MGEPRECISAAVPHTCPKKSYSVNSSSLVLIVDNKKSTFFNNFSFFFCLKNRSTPTTQFSHWNQRKKKKHRTLEKKKKNSKAIKRITSVRFVCFQAPPLWKSENTWTPWRGSSSRIAINRITPITGRDRARETNTKVASSPSVFSVTAPSKSFRAN